MRWIRAGTVVWAVAVGLAATVPAAEAQQAARPMTIVVPYPSGSISYRIASQVAAGIGALRGIKVSLESQAGGGGRSAIERLMKSDPGAVVILFSDMRRVSSAALIDRSFAFDPAADVAPIGALARAPLEVAVGRDATASLAALEPRSGDATSRPWRIVAGPLWSDSYACALAMKNGLYREATVRSLGGTAPALEEVFAGRADLLCDTKAALSLYVANGRLTSRPVEAVLPGVSVAASSWYAVFAPRTTDPAALASLLETMRELRADVGFRESLKALGSEAAAAEELDPEALRNRMKADRALLAPLVEAAGVFVK